MSNRTFLVNMQVSSMDGYSWVDSKVPELIEGDPTQVNVHDFAVDYALDNLPDHSDWRVLVWQDVQDGYDPHSPDTTLMPSDLPTLRPSWPAGVRRGGVAKHRPRTRGPVFDVYTKRMPGLDMIERHILVTDVVAHSVDGRAWPGTSWYAAAGGASTGASVLVRGYGEMMWRGEKVASLFTSVGEIRVAPGVGVVVTDEE